MKIKKQAISLVFFSTILALGILWVFAAERGTTIQFPTITPSLFSSGVTQPKPDFISSPVGHSTPIPTFTVPPYQLIGKIAFINMGDENSSDSGIIIMDLENLESRLVFGLRLNDTPNSGLIWNIAWSPDGTRLALGDGRSLASVNINTQEKINLMYSPASFGAISEMAWSPLGDYIVYTERKYPDYRETSDLVLLNLLDGKTKKVTYTTGNEIHPTWSPTGQEIAFVYEDEILDAIVPNDPKATEDLKRLQYRKIYIMDRDGKESKQAYEFTNRIESLSWSPNGQEFVFTSMERNCGSLYIVSVNGENLRRLNTLGCSESPSWSPDSRYVVYIGRVGQDSYRWDGKWQIYVIDPATGSIVRLTDDPEWFPFLPVWSK